MGGVVGYWGGQSIGGPNISGHSLSQKVLLGFVARFWMSHAGITRFVLESIIKRPLADFWIRFWEGCRLLIVWHADLLTQGIT